MKKKMVLCLFFFCLLVWTGCGRTEGDTKVEKVDGEVLAEDATDGENQDDPIQILVLIDGGEKAEAAAEIICSKMGADYYDITISEKEEVKAAVSKADYILIGTEQGQEKFETNLKRCFEKEALDSKKISLFLIDLEDECEEIAGAFLEWYPGAENLPAFSMSSDEKVLQEEMGRMDGWLTTVLTYDMLKGILSK